MRTWDLKLNGGLLRFKGILEMKFRVYSRHYLFLVRLEDVKFITGLLRIKVILEIEFRFYFSNFVVFDIPTGSELNGVSKDQEGSDEPARLRAGAPRAKDLHKNRRRIT